jgi:sugar phosphate permease
MKKLLKETCMEDQTANFTPIDESSVYAKVTWRIVPFLLLCYVVAYLDRVNVGFAKLQMLSDLKFSDSVFGLGAGIFFIGYFLFEVPSNIIMHKVGARLWIARIMITWGLISALMLATSSEMMFYTLRFLLGLAEAGFFPGIILYLTYWYPAERRGRMTTLFMTAVPLSSVVGAPISGWIMQNMSGYQSLAGWQWMYLLEGVPSVLLGLVTVLYLDDGIAAAKWLNPEEKNLLLSNIAGDNALKQEDSVSSTLANRRVWLLGAIYFCFVMGLYGVGFWLPTIIKSLGVQGLFNIGILTAVPYAAATVGMVFVSRSADARRERRWHVIIPALLGACGLVLSPLLSSDATWSMAAMSLATFGIITTLPLFWSMPTACLGGVAAAAGIALINSLGNLAGFVSPFLIGVIKDATHSTDAGMFMLAVSLVLGALLTLAIPAKLVNR